MKPFAQPGAGGTPLGWLVLLLALVVSVAAVWLLSDLPILTAAYAGGLATLMTLLIVRRGKAAGAERVELAPPDWSVTLTAIDQPGALVAITDRANRLVCASASFSSRFGVEKAPPNLALSDEAAAEALLRTAREAGAKGVRTPRTSRWARTMFAGKSKRSGRGGARITSSGASGPNRAKISPATFRNWSPARWAGCLAGQGW